MKFRHFPAAILCCIVSIHFCNAQHVGIGTPAPQMKFHISSSTDTALLLFENTNPLAAGTSTGMYIRNGSYYTGAIKTTGTGAVFARMGFYTFASSSPDNLLERMSITDEGNVGIGIAAPAAKLDINGDIRIRGGAPGAGKVLTSDAAGLATWQTNPVPNSGFKAVIGSSSYNVFPSTSTKIIFTTEEYDDPGVYFPPTFSAPEAGLYHFDVQLHWNLTGIGSPSQYLMYLLVNSVPRHVHVLNVPAATSGLFPQMLSTDIKLLAGDNVEIEVLQNSGILQVLAGTISAARYSYFSGRRVY